MSTTKITVRYLSMDHSRTTRSFKTLNGARKFAQEWVGKHPEIGGFYAISGDGIGRITVSGASLSDLFPEDDQRSENGDGARQGSEWS